MNIVQKEKMIIKKAGSRFFLIGRWMAEDCPWEAWIFPWEACIFPWEACIFSWEACILTRAHIIILL